MAECDALLDSKESRLDNGNRDLFVLMLATCFAGAIVCPAEELRPYFPTESKEIVARRLHGASLQFLRTTAFPHKPTVRSLVAYILCQSTWLRGKL